MKSDRLIFCSFLILIAPAFALGAQEPNKSDYVSQEQYNALKKELEDIKKQLAELKKTSEPQKIDEKINALDEVLSRAEKTAEASVLGDTKLLIAGDTTIGFVDEENSDSTFTADFNPMFLWHLTDKIFFEGGLEIEIAGPDENGENSETDVELDSAYFAYLLNDYIALGGGKFTTPFTVYHNHLDASWINKLPLDPLIYEDGGIAPDSSVGTFLAGAVPCGASIVNYAAYITNGPALITDDPDEAGSLNFDNYSDQNNNKAVGARIGYLPFRVLEVGYSFQFSKPSPSSFQTVHSELHGVDLNYVSDIDSLYGRVTARGGWVWSQMGKATYDPTGALGFGPWAFDNDRDGGYMELAYRPTKSEDMYTKNLEFVVRYDRMNVSSNAPGGGNDTRIVPGVSYWFTPRAVFKVGYAFDDKENGPDNDIFAVQLGMGF